MSAAAFGAEVVAAGLLPESPPPPVPIETEIKWNIKNKIIKNKLKELKTIKIKNQNKWTKYLTSYYCMQSSKNVRSSQPKKHTFIIS